MRMEPRQGLEFYNYAEYQRQEDKMYLRWIHGYQTVMSYPEFKSQANRNINTSNQLGNEKSEEEIYAKVKNILRKD